MSSEREVVSEASEWRMTVPDDSVRAMRNQVLWYVKKARDWECRQVLYCLKLGLAISLVSLTFYVKPLYQGFSGSALGAILTAASIFDMQVGGTLYKGFMESTANLLAATLAVGVHLLANRTGEKAEPIVRMASVFLLAFAATFARYIQRVKLLFEDGMMTFIIIFILLLVSGYRDNNTIEMAHQRMSSVVIGSSVGALVCMLFFPGGELHHLITQNMEKLANSLDGCVAQFFRNNREIGSDEKCYIDSEGYKNILNSMASEDSLAKWARWEPPHGLFSLQHLWKQYRKVGAELRFCACCIEALYSCLNSEIQILRELAASIKCMTKFSTIDILVIEKDLTVKELQTILNSLPNQGPTAAAALEQREKSQPLCTTIDPSPSLKDLVSFINFASHLIENSSRIKGLISAVDDLAHLACFKHVKNCNQILIEPCDTPPTSKIPALPLPQKASWIARQASSLL